MKQRIIVCFFLIIYNLQIIIGESFTGFWIMYWIGGLTQGLPYAFLCCLGVICILFSLMSSFKKYKQHLICIGMVVMMSGMFLFFLQDSRGYNWGTFQDPVSLSLLITTAVTGLSLFINASIQIYQAKKRKLL